MELIILAVCALILVSNIFLALIRGTRKSVLRLATAVFSAVVAFFLSRAIARGIGEDVALWLEATLGLDTSYAPMFAGAAGADTAMGTLSGMLVAPLLFLLLFWALKGMLFLLYWLLAAVTRPETVDGAASHFIALPIGLLIALVSIFAFISPVMGYLDVINTTVSEMDTGESIEKIEELSAKNTELIAPATRTPVASTLYSILGSKIFDGLTVAKWENEKMHLMTELPLLGKTVGTVQQLFATPKEQFGEAESAAVGALAETVGGSPMLSVLCSGMLNTAASRWLAGEDFLGIAPPDIGANGNIVLSAFLEVFSTSTKDNIAQDIDFFADVFAITVRYEMFAILSEADTETLATLITSNGFLADTRALLAAHPRMQPVGIAVADVGMRSALKAMGLPEDLAQSCGAILTDMATALKGIPTKEGGALDDVALAAKLTEVFAAHELAIGEGSVTLVAHAVADHFTAQELAALSTEEVVSRLTTRFESVDISGLA